MRLTVDEIEEKEDSFYSLFLDEAIGFANEVKNVNGIKFRQLVAAAGVVSKQRQTRGAMKALSYQIARDSKRGLLPRTGETKNARAGN
jgi:hypothetical protein